MSKNSALLFFITALQMGLLAPLGGDEIILKNGERIRGKVLNQSRSRMVIDTVRGRRTVPRRRIRQVLYRPFDLDRARKRVRAAHGKRLEELRLRGKREAAEKARIEKLRREKRRRHAASEDTPKPARSRQAGGGPSGGVLCCRVGDTIT